MKPDMPEVLALIGRLIQDDAVPALGDSYAGAQLQRAIPLLAAVAEEFERAASRRLAELNALRALFAQAAPLVDQAPLARALAAAVAAAPDPDDPAQWRVTALDQRLSEQRALLVSLQAWAEAQAGPAVDALRQALWAELAESTRRRRLGLDRF